MNISIKIFLVILMNFHLTNRRVLGGWFHDGLDEVGNELFLKKLLYILQIAYVSSIWMEKYNKNQFSLGSA
jgi:hypothetical protein